MAQRTIVQLVDDLDGTELSDGETVEFGLDGKSYQIDLSEKNAAKLRSALAVYVDAGRKVGGNAARRRTGGGVKKDTAAVREWANANGFEVGDRGRIPATIAEAYEAAH